MSPKELLYLDDALGHIQFLMCQCRDASRQLSDPALRTQAQQLCSTNQTLFDRFLALT